MLNATEWEIDILQLTSRYSIIITTRFSLVLLIVNTCNSQIYWLSCQIFGISKQALEFVRDLMGKFCIPDENFEKSVLF